MTKGNPFSTRVVAVHLWQQDPPTGESMIVKWTQERSSTITKELQTISERFESWKDKQELITKHLKEQNDQADAHLAKEQECIDDALHHNQHHYYTARCHPHACSQPAPMGTLSASMASTWAIPAPTVGWLLYASDAGPCATACSSTGGMWDCVAPTNYCGSI